MCNYQILMFWIGLDNTHYCLYAIAVSGGYGCNHSYNFISTCCNNEVLISTYYFSILSALLAYIHRMGVRILMSPSSSMLANVGVFILINMVSVLKCCVEIKLGGLTSIKCTQSTFPGVLKHFRCMDGVKPISWNRLLIMDFSIIHLCNHFDLWTVNR